MISPSNEWKSSLCVYFSAILLGQNLIIIERILWTLKQVWLFPAQDILLSLKKNKLIISLTIYFEWTNNRAFFVHLNHLFFWWTKKPNPKCANEPCLIFNLLFGICCMTRNFLFIFTKKKRNNKFGMTSLFLNFSNKKIFFHLTHHNLKTIFCIFPLFAKVFFFIKNIFFLFHVVEIWRFQTSVQWHSILKLQINF